MDDVNTESNVDNTATVRAEAPQGDPSDPADDVTDDDMDDVDIKVDITLSIDKEFDPNVIEVPQGTLQIFTIEVGNSGPSDAVGVSVTDIVDGFLRIESVTVEPVDGGSGSGTLHRYRR